MADHGNGNEESRLQDVNVPLILTIGVISSLLLIVIVIGIQAWFHFEAYHERARKVYTTQDRELVELQTTQRQHLSSYRWVDEEQQQAAIPVDDAMRIFVEQHASRDGTDTAN